MVNYSGKKKYTDGKLNGKEISYYGNGQIKEEGNYKFGKRDGKWIWYNENEQISNKKNYNKGKLTP